MKNTNFTFKNLLLLCGILVFTATASKASVLLNAAAGDAYPQLSAKNYGIEVPDSNHPAGAPHIRTANDSELGKYVFVFYSHPGEDEDSGGDRIRTEIKQNEEASGRPGQTRTYSWKFKLESGFVANGSFCHIHQVHPDGGGAALFTLTCRASYVEIMHVANSDGSGGLRSVAQAPLSEFKGVWLQAVEKIKYNEGNGTYSIVIKRVDNGRVVLQYTNNNIDTWHSDKTYQRPKYGMYRSTSNGGLRDETIRFADICYALESDNGCASDTPTPTTPTAPSNLSASVASCSQINLSWSDNSSNESNFRIQRSSDGSTWSDLATVGANTTSYSNTGLAQTTRYYYRVCALNSAGSSAYTSSVNATTTSCNVTVQKIWLEAENGTLSSPMASYSDATASGGRYIMAPSGTNSSSSAPSSGYSTLSFSVNSAGSYKIWFRTIMATTSTNSFYYRIDGGSWVSWNVDANVSTAWQWNSVATLTLGAGSHTLTIAYREGGTKLDRILLTNDAAYVPTGMGEGTPTTYDNIALEAENGTLSSPMASYTDANASNGSYIMAPSGTNSSSSAPSSGYSTLSFTAAGGSYKMWFRTIMATTSTNSFYYRIDGGSWVSWNVDANVSTAWKWNLVSSSLTLSAGSHTLTIAYREGGTKLDMIAISNDPAYNPSVLKSAVAVSDESDQLIVSPNPAKGDKVSIRFNVSKTGNVKLFVRNSLGQVIANVVSATLAEGQYNEVLDASSLPNGIYYVTLSIDNKPVTVKLSILK